MTIPWIRSKTASTPSLAWVYGNYADLGDIKVRRNIWTVAGRAASLDRFAALPAVTYAGWVA